MDWTKESIILQRNLALGDAKHRRLVQNLYEDVRQGKSQSGRDATYILVVLFLVSRFAVILFLVYSN